MNETWAPIPGFDGYAASSKGRVIGPRGLLSTPKTRGGYLTCSIRAAGKKTTTTVQRLVLLAFVGQPPTDKHEANHKNGDKTDNTPPNLEWVTGEENKRHARNVLKAQIGRKKKPRPAMPARDPLELLLLVDGQRFVVYGEPARRCNQWRLTLNGEPIGVGGAEKAWREIQKRRVPVLGERNLL